MTNRIFFKHLYSYARKYSGKFIIATVIMALGVVMEATIPEVTGQMTDGLFSDDPTSNTPLFFSLVIFFILLLRSVFYLLSSALNSVISNSIAMDLRKDLFAKYLRLPQPFIEKFSVGSLISKQTFEIEQIAELSSDTWVLFWKSLLMCVTLTAYLFYKNWQLSLILLLMLPLIYGVVVVFAAAMLKASKNVQEGMSEVTSILEQCINAHQIIKIYRAQAASQKRFDEKTNKVRHSRFRTDILSAFNSAMVGFIIGISLAITVYLAGTVLDISSGDFIAFFVAMSMLVKPAKSLSGINKPLQQAKAATDSVFKILAYESPHTKWGVKPKNAKGEISFQNVCFSYEKNKDKHVLDNINLCIKPRESIALVGETGCGKTTLTQLLMRFYRPTKGVILLDGENVNTFGIEAYRDLISLVSQKSLALDLSIAENISLGNPKISKTQIETAANKAGVLDFALKLERGLETPVGSSFLNFSGGELQRIAIARALAKDAPIFIFDEATSSLDQATERKIVETINTLKLNKTLIIIAHRPEAIRHVDRIVVMKNGKIVEQGKHKELILLNGPYQKLMSSSGVT